MRESNKKSNIEKNLEKQLEIKEIIAGKQDTIPEGFIKVTDNPVLGLSSENKAILNRKANVMFNNGNIEDARRIYITTGYSDGLTRVGDYYMDHNQNLKALKQYTLAHNARKAEPIYDDIAKVISSLLKEK